ncbi:MAG: sugar-binding transcriptional regulator [Nitratireductor sp.]|nr:sugar-binding transcriptional regulator [Nitratireductor sp.]
MPRDPVQQRQQIEDQIIEAAWAYYHDDLNQSEIAEKLGLSRATVVNYLSEARRREYIRISLNPDVFRERQISNELKEKFGLRECLVVPAGETADRTLSRVARAASDWLPTLLVPGDSLGVSWGETIFKVSQYAEPRTIPDLEIVQLVGSMTTPLGFAAETCSANLAQKFGANCINLHAPLLLEQAGLAEMLRAEPVIARQLDAVRNCNKVLFAAGSCNPDSHVVRCGLVSLDLLEAYKAKGARAVICGRFIDAEGNAIIGKMDSRMIGADIAQMKGKDTAILVSAGLDRVDPIMATIKAGITTHFVTCSATARAMLKM